MGNTRRENFTPSVETCVHLGEKIAFTDTN